MAGAFGLALAACGPSVTDKAARIGPAGSDIGAVDHVVFLMHENRSFDHYFGTYPGVRGFSDLTALPGVFNQRWDGSADGYSGTVLPPFHLDTSAADAECTFDLSHEWNAQHMCWNSGAMDSFVTTHTAEGFEGPGSGVLTMGYYTRQDLAYWYSLADAFTICDNYHCSVFGPTHPNRMYALSGTLDPGGHEGGPILVTNESSAFIGSAKWKTMPEELESKGVSWKVYNPPSPAYQPTNPVSLALSDNILLYFHRHVSDPTSLLYKKAFGPTFPADFRRDIAHDELPAVSWIVPPIGYDEHPPSPPAAGMWFANEVLSALVSNPKVWSKTVLFIMYDENDGFFDHVPPPVPAAGTADEFVTAKDHPAAEKGIDGPIGFGFRVPLLVVSPFSRGGYVCSDVFDHTSQLRFLEARFGVTVPNLSAWRRRSAGDLTSCLHATRSDLSVPALPATDPRSALVRAQCAPSQLSELNVTNPPPYPIPMPLEAPVQEPGTARRLT
jgi:phospholipase C